jgi:hypothetical protein
MGRRRRLRKKKQTIRFFETRKQLYLTGRILSCAVLIGKIKSNMKKLTLTILVVAALFTFSYLHAENKPTSANWEYAIVKWDGPDRLFYNLPDKFEMVHIEKEGVTIPKEAQAEEFCLAYAANKMAKSGWEPASFDSRRILFRRAVK